MAVLMSYHKLIERDSKHVGYCWKLTTICILILAAASSLAGSWALQKLIIAYDDHCVLHADLKFKLNVTQDSSTFSYASASSFSSSALALRAGFEEQNVMNYTIIDDKTTKWGMPSTCDYAVFIPIFQFCFGIIITVMFVICGKGGHSEVNHSFLPQPWRIVVPALIFFLFMSCVSIANLASIQGGLDIFCLGFVNELPNEGCRAGMDHFAINKSSFILPSIFYIIVLTFSWCLVIFWITLMCIMIARIIFVVDFQLVRVTIKTVENEDENCSYKTAEPPEDDQNGNNDEESVPC